MEDFQIDIVLGQGPGGPVDPARPAPLHARRGHHPHRLITGPLRDRFGLVARLDYYEPDRPRGDRHPRRRHPRRRRSTTTVPARSPGGPGARRASPTGCCAGCATSPRCGATAPSTRPPRPTGWPLFGVDDRGLDKVDRAILVGHLRALRRRSRRPVHAGHQRGRADRDGRGRLRAVPHPAGPAHAHAPGPGGHRGRVGAPRPARPRDVGRRAARPACSAEFARREALGTLAAPMDTADLDYELPHEAIAQTPVEPRDAARLLVDRGPGAEPDHRHVRDLPDLVRPGDVVVVNTTRVLPARLALHKPTGGAVEVLAARPPRPDGGVGGARAARAAGWPAGTALDGRRRPAPSWWATTWARAAGSSTCDSGARGRPHDALDAPRRRAAAAVHHRAARRPRALPDRLRAADPDRSAAPTAGLHLTPTVLDAMRGGRAPGGAASSSPSGSTPSAPSRPTRSTTTAMHAERYRVPEATMAACRRGRARWWPSAPPPCGRSSPRPRTGELEGRTELFIHGDRPFAVVDALLTNFHLPRSSLLVLIDAFVGPRWREPLRRRPLGEGYRFLSFGDAMLLDTVRADDASRSRSTPPTAPARAGVITHGPRELRHAVLHAGRHPRRGAHAVVGRPRGPRAPRSCSATPTTSCCGPGPTPSTRLGGLHGFMDWSGHVLTDSGGYQVFSLEPKVVDDDGVTFRSTYDGSTHRLTPEGAVDVQTRSGADIQMVLDVCPPLPSPPEVLRLAVDRTAAWAARARPAFLEPGAAGAQPVRHRAGRHRPWPARRERPSAPSRSASTATASVGCRSASPATEMLAALAATLAARCPPTSRATSWAWAIPIGMVEAIALGVDLFDCVLPTRLARHGTILIGRRPLQPEAGRERRRRRPARPRPAAARSAPAGPGPTSATCWWWTSPPPPGCSPSTTLVDPPAGGGGARGHRGRTLEAVRSRVRAAYGNLAGRPHADDPKTEIELHRAHAGLAAGDDAVRRPSRGPMRRGRPNGRASGRSWSSWSSRSERWPGYWLRAGVPSWASTSRVASPSSSNPSRRSPTSRSTRPSRSSAAASTRWAWPSPRSPGRASTIVVQLPGVDDQERALELVGQTAELRFRPVLAVDPGGHRGPRAIHDDDGCRATTTTTATTAAIDDRRAGDPVAGRARRTARTRPRRRRAVPGPSDHHHDRPPARPVTRRRATAGHRLRAHAARGRPARPARSSSPSATTTARSSSTYQLGPAGRPARSLERRPRRLIPDRRSGRCSRVQGRGRHRPVQRHGRRVLPRDRRPAPRASWPSCSTPTSMSAPTIQQASFERDQIEISGDFTESRGQGPGPRAALRLAAGRARGPADPGGVGHAGQRRAAGRADRRHRRPVPRQPLHGRLLPAARAGGGGQPRRLGGAPVGDHRLPGRDPGPGPHPRRHHRHHRVDRRGGRLQRRLLRAPQGGGVGGAAPLAASADGQLPQLVHDHRQGRTWRRSSAPPSSTSSPSARCAASPCSSASAPCSTWSRRTGSCGRSCSTWLAGASASPSARAVLGVSPDATEVVGTR